MRDLYAAREIEIGTDLEFFAQPLTSLFGDGFDRIKITDFFAVEDAEGHTVSVVLAVKDDLLLSLPGLEGFSFGVVVESVDEWPLIYCEIQVGGSSHSLSLENFPLRIEIANPLLKPLTIDGQQRILDGFSFELEGSFLVGSDLTVSATLDSFSLPPFEIVATGLTLALHECRLVTDQAAVDAAITGLGFNQHFRGIYAASALLDWQLPMQFEAFEAPGIHASLAHVALGNQGISLSAELNWPVAHDSGNFDPTGTELLGSLFGWRCALASFNVVVQANVPTALGAAGFLRLPFLEAIFGLELYLSYAGDDDYQLQASLTLGTDESVVFPLGQDDCQLSVHSLRISGGLTQDGNFEFAGSTGCAIALPQLEISAQRAGLSLRRDDSGERYAFLFDDLDIDTLGRVEQAELSVIAVRDDAGASVLREFMLTASVAWSDLSALVVLNQVPDAFPLPPDDARMTLQLRWVDGQMLISAQVELEDVDLLWRFIPAAQRPDVDSASIKVRLTAAGSGFDGELSLSVRCRLPQIGDLPGLAAAGLDQVVRVETGDEAGWIEAEFTADLDADGGDPTGSLSASLAHPLELAFNLPGLMLPQPPLEISVETIALELSRDAQQLDGEFRLGGDFALRPILPSDLAGLVPSPMAIQLERLLAIAHVYDLLGAAELRLGMSGDAAYLSLDCRFLNAGLELDLFNLLQGATAQLSGAEDNRGSEIDIDIEVSFALSKLSLSIGRMPDAEDQTEDGIPFAFGLVAELGFAGQYTELAFALSRESLSFGITELAIPIMLPQLPISRSDLDELRAADGRWQIEIWQQEIEPSIDLQLAEAETSLQQARADLDALGVAELDDQNEAARQRFELQYRTIPALQKDIFRHTGQKFLYQAILAVHQLLGQLSSTASQAVYQGMVETYQDAVDLAIGSLHFDTQLQFVIADARFVLPFNDPSDIRVEGGASLQGFAPDDPLAPLADLQFKLGLSADSIFFALEGGSEPIPLPDLGRYPGSGVVLDRLLIGYGYSKNSLKIDFSGELLLSPKLIEDADTSQRLGAGIRLPVNNRLKFKIDLIPIVLGEVDFLLPLIAFDIDLRSDPPPPVSVSDRCAPAWDGLQLNAPGVFRADFKRAAFSPFFGPLPAPNYLYSFDLDIGDQDYGLTQVCSAYQVITPVLGTLPIPFLADASPYFDQLCSNLRLAGFGINFDLRRPFPHPDPLMIFELMGFLSDPALPIDPAGHLANLMWAEIRNTRITLPPPVFGMFPEQGRVIGRDLDARINVGTVIALGQQLRTMLNDLQVRLAQAGDDAADMVDGLVQDPPQIAVLELLELLPRELRRVELKGGFVGFEASAVFLLVSPQSLRERLSPTVEEPPPDDALTWVTLIEDRFIRNPLRGWRAVDHGLKRGKGDWRIARGALVQHNNVGDNSAGRYGAMLIRETDPLSDLRITVDMHSTDNDGMGVVFHQQGDTTFYRFRITAEQNEWQLMRLKRGRTRLLHTTDTAFVPNRDYRVRIETRSVLQSSASPTARPDPSSTRLTRRELARYTTHIRIWINEILWCDLSDADGPLTEGQVGLDSWWNKGARYDNFRIDLARRGSLALSRAATLSMTRDLVSTTSRRARQVLPAAAATAWLADDLGGFDDADLLLAIPEAAPPAVVVTARVQVLPQQIYRFVGVMQSDGYFSLLTTVDTAPLKLSVAGIEAYLSLAVHGRLKLTGQAAGADSFARVEARLYGEWELLPAPDGALASLVVGSEAAPVKLTLGSRGEFSARGSGRLLLFAGQVQIDGSIDISERHAFVSGQLEFVPDLFVVSQQRLLALSLDCGGRLGPQHGFELTGTGSLQLLGKNFSRVSGQITPHGMMLETSLMADNENWDINGFQLTGTQLSLRGRVDFDTLLPSVLFEGSGRFGWGDLDTDGQCRISAGDGYWLIAVAGNLHWQGRDWLQGVVELRKDSLTVQGQTSFTLNLTPAQLPADIQIANLYLSASVSGSFTLRSSGRLKACNFDIDWTLAVRLPGGHARQMLPIASQRLNLSRSGITSAGSVNLIDLINIDGWTLLPLEGLTIPLPTIDADSLTDIYLHDGIAVNPPAVSFPIPVVSGFPPDQDPPPEPWVSIPTLIAGNVDLYSYQPNINIPEFNVPLPVLSDQPPSEDPTRDPLLSIPNIAIQDVDLDGSIDLARLKLGLKLVWKEGQLGIKVVQTGAFHAFAGLPSLLPLTGSLISGLMPMRN